MAQILKANDAISGKEGTAFMTINGRNIELFYLKNIDATIEFTKTEVPALGQRMVQQKIIGASGSGSMTIHKITSEFAKIAIDYVKSGKIPSVTIKITNADKQTAAGRQTTILKDVLFDTISIAKLDIEAETLDEDVDFTFSGADMFEQFKKVK